MLSSSSAFVIGTPPRMRGALRLLETDLMTKGIIPAYAGSTLF